MATKERVDKDGYYGLEGDCWDRELDGGWCVELSDCDCEVFF